MLRSVMLKVASNRALLRTVYKLGNRRKFTRRFIAGETMTEAMEVVRDLNGRGIVTSLDVLGEGVADEAEARKAAESYISVLDGIAASGVSSNISIKLTQLGLDISRELCCSHLQMILAKAKQLGNFVRIDMESSAHTQATLELFEEQAAYSPRHVGIVIQSYLYRSEEDVRRIAAKGCNVRLCKGAYMEPATVAFPQKKDVDRNYVKLMEILLTSPAYTAIATHDDAIIGHARRFIEERGISKDRYEFQMLYGVRRESQLTLARAGYRVRVYVPFGRSWAPYFMRRLAERPANVLFIAKNLLRK